MNGKRHLPVGLLGTRVRNTKIRKGDEMNSDENERLRWLISATPEQLAEFDRMRSGQPEEKRSSLRLLRIGEAAEALGVSRCTIWRALREQRLHAVTIRKGSRRIAEEELKKLVEGKQ